LDALRVPEGKPEIFSEIKEGEILTVKYTPDAARFKI